MTMDSNSLENTAKAVLSDLSTEAPSEGSTLDRHANGAVILGNDIKRGNRYVTRYRIDRDKQRELVRSSVRVKECMPCMVKKERTPRKAVWDVVRGEAFLLSLHILIVALGAAKEALDMETVANDIELIHSSLETIVTCLIIFIRIASTRHGYLDIVEYRKRMEVWQCADDPTTAALRRYVQNFAIFGGVIIVLAIIAFFVIVFVESADHAWTIVTNNAALIAAGGVGGQVQAIIQNEMQTLREDQHKAVIYESIMLMTECIHAKDTEAKVSAYGKAEHFCRALRDTELLQQPEYVTYADTRSDLDLVTSLQVVSML